MTDQNLEAQSLFETARAISGLDPVAALDMVIEAHRKALDRKAKAAGELAAINSQIRLLGASQKKAKKDEAEADAILEKARFLISALESAL